MITHLLDFIAGKAPLQSKRSSGWSKVRQHHLVSHPTCALCGSDTKLNVHHIKPFHLHPELELEPTNLITLCESTKHGVNCHLWFGHLGNFKHINPAVLADIPIWVDKFKVSKDSNTL